MRVAPKSEQFRTQLAKDTSTVNPAAPQEAWLQKGLEGESLNLTPFKKTELVEGISVRWCGASRAARQLKPKILFLE